MTNPAYEATNSDVEKLKPGKYAILYRDNWDGEGDVYHCLADLDMDGRWLSEETGKQLLEYVGDEILKAWPLDDGADIQTLIAALEQAKLRGDEWKEKCREAVEHGANRIAELEATSTMREPSALCVKPLCVKLPDEFARIAENLRTQDNRVTSDPMFCVFQKREIVTDEDYDYDRIVWIDEDGNEATTHQRRRLELLHENSREAPEKWRRIAVKEINDFVTCCFTEQGCKDYLACNGHNLRLPFIYVKSGFRNAEYQTMRNWLMAVGTVEGSE
ncbi:hypothetical protein M977_03789 [Buttiauxella gaviniae ATCC 51604]|uniref:Uncharacterized protein n=1 Tax=Buttiauxella gaviniae ATCC 51604 TaxID=1354253 RepID=A0A1B7HQV2_9ENTR|nr:hypothetical protein M977_03789 [Buttiauxella gaviniae ATCC 51604]